MKNLVNIASPTLLLQHLAASQMTGRDIEKTWERIQVFGGSKYIFRPNLLQDLVVKSVVSGLGEMRKEWQKSGCNTRYNSYKLLGGTKSNLEQYLGQATMCCWIAT